MAITYQTRPCHIREVMAQLSHDVLGIPGQPLVAATVVAWPGTKGSPPAICDCTVIMQPGLAAHSCRQPRPWSGSSGSPLGTPAEDPS